MTDSHGAPLEEGRSASYRMEKLDSAQELPRLAAQVQLVRGMEDDFLGRAGLTPHAHLLDLGCGPGFFAERVARELLFDGGGRVTAVDVDPTLLEHGRSRLREQGLPIEFLVGTGSRIPLDDDSVDFAYARFLFQHLSDPAAVLAEMVRVTRPGGIVAVGDTDDGALVVHPEPEGFAELIEASRVAQAARGGDRHIGRKLRGLFVERGLEAVGTAVYPFTSDDVGPTAFLAVSLGFKREIVGPDLMSAEAVHRVLDGLRAVAQTPSFFGHGMGYGVWGVVPATAEGQHPPGAPG